MIKPSHGRYENVVVGALCVSFGTIALDMIGINYLMPFILKTLHLNNFQVGTALSIYWISFAISSYLAGAISDNLQARKLFVVGILCLFVVLCVLSGFARSFEMFLAARLAMGLVAGAFLPPAQSIVAVESDPNRLGLNMGLLQNVGSSLAAFVAPLFLVYVAAAYNWRVGFFVIAVPALVCVALVGFGVREPAFGPARTLATPDQPASSAGQIRQLLTYRNVYLCTAIGALFTAESTIGHGFIPLYYTRVALFTPAVMGALMSVLGVSGAIFGLVLPALSDRLGRRPITIVACALGVLCPLGSLYFHGSILLLSVSLFLGWAPAGATAVYTATILSETVPRRLLGTAFGLVGAVATVGGVLAGPVAGWTADRWGLSIPLAIEAACCLAMAAIACALRETAPAKRPLPTGPLVADKID